MIKIGKIISKNFYENPKKLSFNILISFAIQKRARFMRDLSENTRKKFIKSGNIITRNHPKLFPFRLQIKLINFANLPRN